MKLFYKLHRFSIIFFKKKLAVAKKKLRLNYEEPVGAICAGKIIAKLSYISFHIV